MAGEPDFLGFLTFSMGTDCPCGYGIRRLTVTKLWHSADTDTRGFAWGYGMLELTGHYLQATSSGWESQPNTVYRVDRLTGLIDGPDHYQNEPGKNSPPGMTLDGTLIQYGWSGIGPTLYTFIALSEPYTAQMVSDDLEALWVLAPAQVVLVPWGAEGTLGRAEVGNGRWRPSPPSWLGPGPADGRVIQVLDRSVDFTGATSFGAQTIWNYGIVQRQLLQFTHRGFFSVQRDDVLDNGVGNFERVTYPKEYFYLVEGVWEVESPAPEVGQMAGYRAGDYLVTVLLGDKPPGGTPWSEVRGKGRGGAPC